MSLPGARVSGQMEDGVTGQADAINYCQVELRGSGQRPWGKLTMSGRRPRGPSQ